MSGRLAPIVPGRLAPIVETRRAAVALAKARRPTAALWDELARRADAPPRGFAHALSQPGLAVIAELKRRSPSLGSIRPQADAAEMALRYAGAGAAALSILTEFDHVGGGLEDLRRAREVQHLALLRKDFVVDVHQVVEGRLAGADAVLLMVAVLGRELGRLIEACDRAGLEALVEVHDAEELSLALDAGARIVGVNNRNLVDMSVDLGVSERLLPAIPGAIVKVAESGVESGRDALRMRAAGADAVLVGGALMRARDPAAMVAELRQLCPA